MTKIPLTQGQFALVDDEDYCGLITHRWQSRRNRPNWTYYAIRSIGGKKNRVCQKMHRLIMSANDGEKVDHRDGNGLNNQKSNLRICSTSQNQMNSRLRTNNTSGYKGVSWHKGTSKWQARIKIEGKQINLGVYFCLIKAAKAYDKAAIEHFGEFARYNFNR